MNRYIFLILFFLLIPLALPAQRRYEIELDTIFVRNGFQFRNGHRLYFAYEFIYPTDETVPLTKIRTQIIKSFFECENMEFVTLETAETNLRKEIIDDISAYDTLEEDSHIGRHYDERYSAIRIVNSEVLVYMIQYYWYRGGNHGLEPCSIENYDLQTGEKITIDDLFPEKFKSNMLELMNKQITTPLISETWLTDNFMILPKGIKFKFNSNQIGSYSDGQIDATIKFSEFKHLLKPDAIRYFISE